MLAERGSLYTTRLSPSSLPDLASRQLLLPVLSKDDLLRLKDRLTSSVSRCYINLLIIELDEMMRGSSQEPSPYRVNRLVRRFSEKMSIEMPEDVLTTSLASKEAQDEAAEKNADSLGYRWQHLFSADLSTASLKSNEELLLEKPSHELAQAWLKFQKLLPAGHASKVDDAPPNIADVWNAVTAANASWTKKNEESKIGKSKRMFGKLCQSLDNHKDLFDMLPNNDKYISLITGSLASIVKATINHEKIAKGISTGLDNICDDISYWRRQMDVHASNTYMKSYIAELYVLIFSLLVDIMTWFKSSFRRLVHSFDGAYFDDLIQSKQIKMQSLAQKLENEGKLATEAKIQQLPTKEEISNMVSEKLARFMQELEKRQGMLGKLVQTSIRDEVGSYIWRNDFAISSSTPASALMDYSSHPNAIKPVQRYSTSQIQANGYRLQRYHHPDTAAALIDQTAGLNLDAEAFLRIQTWTASSKSETLWIQGPFQATIPSRYTLTSAYLVFTAQKADIQVLAYFCQYPGERRRNTIKSDYESDEEIDEETASVTKESTNLVYSLISQLLDSLPPGAIESELDFTSSRFKSLTITPDSLPAAISLLEDLISIGPHLLFCVIDGLQFLKQETQESLWPLVDMLRAKRDDGRVVKALYTTDGFVELLAKLDNSECLSVLDFGTGESGLRDVDAIDIALLTEF